LLSCDACQKNKAHQLGSTCQWMGVDPSPSLHEGMNHDFHMQQASLVPYSKTITALASS
jgi:hypothetical protein